MPRGSGGVVADSARAGGVRQRMSWALSYRDVALQIMLGCGAALIASGLTAGVRVLAPGYALWFMYMPLIGLAAYFGGQLAGMIAAVASILSVWHLGTMRPWLSASALWVFGGFCFTSVVVGWISGRFSQIKACLETKTREILPLAAIVESSSDAIFSKTLDGILLTWNGGAERLYGYSADEAIGQPVAMLAPPDRPDEIPAIMRRLRRGERIQHYETVRVRKDGTRVHVSLTISPVRNDRGVLTAASTVARDITERKRIEAERDSQYHHIRALSEITAALSGAVTATQVADAVLRRGAEMLEAEAGVIYTLDSDRGKWTVLRSVDTVSLRGAAWKDLPNALGGAYLDADRDQQVLVFDSRDALLRRYPEWTGLAHQSVGPRVVAPLRSPAEARGVLVFVLPPNRTIDEGQRDFVSALASACSQALDRARLYDREHRVAETLQRALLPDTIGQVPGATIQTVYVPGSEEASVGGDWYDLFQLPDGRIALAVGDVMGRGTRAAVVMGQARQAMRVAALDDANPPRVLQRTQQVLALAHKDNMVTALFGIVDPSRLTFTYAAAGHPGPIVGTPTMKPRRCPTTGLPLGVAGHEPTIECLNLEPGTVLVLYTDGLLEVTRDPIAGEAALLMAVQAELTAPSSDSAYAIVQNVLDGHSAQDDIAVLLLRVAATPLDREEFSPPHTATDAGRWS
jgi:PAS domain S-box-containing protein